MGEHFVLIHGAWHGGWCWDGVIQELVKAGHTAEAFNKLAIPKSVVFCKGDVSLPPGAYLGMAKGLGEFDLIEVDGSHETLFTNPGVVAEACQQALR
jgi:hypothetical protein